MHIPLEAVPTSSTLFLDYVRSSSTVERFYPNQYSIDAVERFSRARIKLDSNYREQLAGIMESQQGRWGVDPSPAKRLASGAVAVITGHQAGLFGGPMFCVLKALTAVKVAMSLCDRGVDAVPVFWIAAEDHDIEEIEWAGILGNDADFHKVTANLVGEERAPVGWMRFNEGIRETIETCFDVLPASEFRADVLDLIQDTYRPDTSPVDAFGGMMGRLFDGMGLIFVDPLEPSFRNLSESVMGRVVDRVDDLRAAVIERSRQISDAGYLEQVRVDEAFTGFFKYCDGVRQPLRVGEITLASALSPNALVRPFVQDSVFPTAAIVGGPAEIAYFAQAGAVYECFGVAMPPIFPRITATVLEPSVSRIMNKFDLQMEDVFDGPDTLRRKAVGEIQDITEFGQTRDEVIGAVEGLRRPVEAVDQTLGDALDNALRKMRYQIDRLETRFINAKVHRNQTLDRQLRTVSSRLFPGRKLQERTVNATSFLVRYGMGLVRMLDERLELDGTVHQVIEL